ncbi:hypothetical protein BDZ89DRAFT_1107427 [Hymenopellis radicata]|nr:hypothetical protein BDZ89DRAFT_1107427 [Hymenopellis radicata]
MAYQDPYAGQYGRYDHDPQYAQASQDVFNPYAPNQQPHDTYEHGGYTDYNARYRDDPVDHNNYGVQRQPSTRTVGFVNTQHVPKPEGPSNGFDQGEFTPQEKTAFNLKAYRYESQGNLWTRGSRVGCIGRFCCCTVLIVAFIFISIILALALADSRRQWIRPPAVIIGTISQPTTGSQFQLTDNGVTINFNLNVSVSNPNYFGVDLKKVQTQLFYPINNTDIGGGLTNNVNFPSNSNKTVTFPFSIDYTSSLDPNNAILLDLLQKCGVLGQPVMLRLTTRSLIIQLSIRILIITVSPSISNSFTFTCPLDASSLEGLMNSSGLNIGDILGGS